MTIRRILSRRLAARLALAAVLLAAASGQGALLAQDGTPPKKAKGQKEPKEAREAKGDGRAKVQRDSVAAVERALFASDEPLPFTLVANFGNINKDRDSTSKARYAGTMVVRDAGGEERRIAVQLRTRGHFRLKRSTCRFVNLLVIFPDKGKETEGTPFEGQKSLKLGAHCQDNPRYEQLLLKEYLAYRIFNVVTPRSFRARLATGTYVDSANGKTLATRVAMFLENEDEMAARQGGKVRELRRALFADVEPTTLDQAALFEYLIGNTDWSIYALHNIRLVVTDGAGVLTIPYDFDFSGLVNAPYAGPPPQLPIRSVRDRLYRGPCRPYEALEPSIARFLERQEEIQALPARVPGLERNEVRDVQEFLAGFFQTARDPRQARQQFTESCVSKPGM